MSDTELDEQAEVLILGGGVAGLGLACQLKAAEPDIDVAVIEKRKHPVPVATHKVGESTVPVAARYLREILGMEEHLKAEQLPKMGLRFFATQGDNTDITKRPELGPPRFPVLNTYQLDRGLLENALGEKARELGVAFVDDARVTGVEIGDPAHTVTVANEADETREIAARYLIDASGRASILKHKLGLEEPAEHTANAAWFRLGSHIKVDEWSDDPDWQGRVASPDRWLSTVHLHGPGYWVWLIPLGSGSMSVGVVADPEFVPFERLRRFESVLEWLHENEPQVAAEIDKRADQLQDFHTRKDYSRKCSTVFSADRWFITGDAGYFHDPLYSPGMDMISAANVFLGELIRDLRAGREDMDQQIAIANLVFKGFAEDAFVLYEQQYGMLAAAETTSVKVTWEQLSYLGLPAALAWTGNVVEDSFAFVPSVAPELGRNIVLNKAFHVLLNDWAAIAQEEGKVGQVGMLGTTRMASIQHALSGIKTEADSIKLIQDNMNQLEDAFREIARRVAAVLGRELPADEALLRADARLAEFRLIDCPKVEPDPDAPTTSECGLLWATASDPDGAVTESWGAWPAAMYEGHATPDKAAAATG